MKTEEIKIENTVAVVKLYKRREDEKEMMQKTIDMTEIKREDVIKIARFLGYLKVDIISARTWQDMETKLTETIKLF